MKHNSLLLDETNGQMYNREAGRSEVMDSLMMT